MYGLRTGASKLVTPSTTGLGERLGAGVDKPGVFFRSCPKHAIIARFYVLRNLD
jgi:hypothetical protein